jgi:hypothetical protein
MKFLRNIGGETRWNGNRNESSTEYVRIPRFVNIITREKLQWFGHFSQIHDFTI